VEKKIGTATMFRAKNDNELVFITARHLLTMNLPEFPKDNEEVKKKEVTIILYKYYKNEIYKIEIKYMETIEDLPKTFNDFKKETDFFLQKYHQGDGERNIREHEKRNNCLDIYVGKVLIEDITINDRDIRVIDLVDFIPANYNDVFHANEDITEVVNSTTGMIIHYPYEALEQKFKLYNNNPHLELDYIISEGPEITSTVQRPLSISNNIGYIYYDIGTSHGSCGGCILDRFGRLIGIHHGSATVPDKILSFEFIARLFNKKGVIVNVGTLLLAGLICFSEDRINNVSKNCTICRDKNCYYGHKFEKRLKRSKSYIAQIDYVLKDYIYGNHEITREQSD